MIHHPPTTYLGKLSDRLLPRLSLSQPYSLKGLPLSCKDLDPQPSSMRYQVNQQSVPHEALLPMEGLLHSVDTTGGVTQMKDPFYMGQVGA